MARWGPILALAMGGCPAPDVDPPSDPPDPTVPDPTAETGTDPTTPTVSSGDTGGTEVVPVDVAVQLAAIDGMTVEEASSTGYPYRTFSLVYLQPVDHDDPGGATFEQHLTLVHYDLSLPMTLVSSGGADFLGDTHQEPTVVLGTNQVVVEKRFHGQSRPDPADWTKMTIEQIAADAHQVREALGAVYPGPWIATGVAMGGADAVYYRYHHPDDVVGTIAYVAPFQLAYRDDRYPTWFATVPDPACQQALEAVQIALLGEYRDEMLASLAADPYADPTGRVGLEPAYEATVLSLPWTFWQYFGEDSCGDVPDALVADGGTLFGFYDLYGFGLYLASDAAFDAWDPYYWQVQAELGPPEIPDQHLAGLIAPDRIDIEEGILPVGAPSPVFEARNPPIVDWVETSADRLILVYGEWDPWSAGGIFPASNPGVQVYTVPHGNHGAQIELLPELERDEAWAIVDGWMLTPPASR